MFIKLISFIAIILILAGCNYDGKYTDTASQVRNSKYDVTMPQLIGAAESNVYDLLDNAGVNGDYLRIHYPNNSGHYNDNNIVIEQSPLAGTKIPSATTTDVWVQDSIKQIVINITQH